MKHYVFGKVKDEVFDETYKCVVVDAPSSTDYTKIEEQAEKENEGFTTFEVVTRNWAKLYNKYSKLWVKCTLNDLFDDDVLYREINGYSITERALCDCLYVCVDDYNDTTIPIYYLNEVEFGKVVEMLEVCVDSVK
jgi:hypothetical protein